MREASFRRPAQVSAVDPAGVQDRDRAAEEGLDQDLERGRGPAEVRHQDLVRSFPLEGPQMTGGCLSDFRAANHEWLQEKEQESVRQGLRPQDELVNVRAEARTYQPVPTGPHVPAFSPAGLGQWLLV